MVRDGQGLQKKYQLPVCSYTANRIRRAMRRAKIVCTLGPASREPTFIGNLIDEGMDVARINFSHGDPEDLKAVIAAVRSEAEKRGRPVAVLQDLQGPKIRVGRFVTGSTELEPG